MINEPIPQITVEELAIRLADRDPDLQLIDVREPNEIEIAYIEGFTVLPLSEFSQWSPQINTQFNPSGETLVLCHHGMRSAQMCQWLRNAGFTNVKNIVGGIDAYSLLIDPNIPRY
ncbi:Rhodanese domain protein [Gloeothece citriformis PCC 7424]|uniref:Rhodanese domain protein n=1 Tax=Gloeothece citriformis (strain PCC 7424) TaxID=65393 RepID=B7K744_GLOC7|nr:rhodanese-like domain-containing protein [Gloeothece citriformis]ACK69612.1 Rhodanese domain protein [Gloeothece citriformis PCC 7424]